MSKETLQNLNINTLIGNANARGHALSVFLPLVYSAFSPGRMRPTRSRPRELT